MVRPFFRDNNQRVSITHVFDNDIQRNPVILFGLVYAIESLDLAGLVFAGVGVVPLHHTRTVAKILECRNLMDMLDV